MSGITTEQKQFAKNFYDKLWKCKTKEALENFYDENIEDYDKLCEFIELNRFATASVVGKIKHFFDNGDFSRLKFLDIGCGTGEVGRQLSDIGFKIIDGLDISTKMLEVCRKKGFYKKLIKEPLTTNETPGIEENTYDAAFSNGCYVENHIPLDTLEEVRRIVKPGGYIVYTLNDPNNTMNYMDVQGQFMVANKLKLISMELIKYKREVTIDFDLVYGYLVVFQVLA